MWCHGLLGNLSRGAGRPQRTQRGGVRGLLGKPGEVGVGRGLQEPSKDSMCACGSEEGPAGELAGTEKGRGENRTKQCFSEA